MDPYVLTVLGRVPPESLGLTLTHEHLYVDARAAGTSVGEPDPRRRLTWANAAEARWDPLAFPDNLAFTNVDLTVAELAPFREAGGGSIVDLTPTILGRSPRALADISKRAGIHVVMGGGYYTTPFHPAWLASATDEDIASTFIDEIRDGVDDTGIRPGIMGEVGCGDPVTPGEMKVLRAHGIAAIETGVAISIHQQSWSKHGQQIVGALLDVGSAPGRIVLGHMTPVIDDGGYQRSLLDMGVFLSYDFLGIDHSILAYGKIPPDPPGRYPPSDYDVIAKVAELVRAGYSDRILLSGDTGELIRMRAYGGWGYAHIPEHVVPLMRALGIDDRTVHEILVDNPRRLLTISGD
jgi:phosphotriesterase-related protein